MTLVRKTTLTAGSLFIIGTIAGVLSIAPAIDTSDYLVQASANEYQVIIAAVFQFIMAIAYIGFAVLLYPILKKFNDSLAVGFISFKLIAGVFNLIGVIVILLLLTLSKEYIEAGSPDSSYFQTFGTLLRSTRDLVNHVVMILVHCLGGLMLYYIFYKTRLVPRWLSYWGFVGTIFTIVTTFLVLFSVIEIVTPIYIILSMPMALLELVLAIWLIIKGLNPLIIDSVYK